ncbi:MAG: primosomal replication protein N [Burkholderiales bacterium]|nr:primosomal replication protein N [Burkholderiales bacterium]
MEPNEVILGGRLTAIEPLRYTPAGVPLASFRLLHRSELLEAGVRRQVECEVAGIALAQVAVGLSGLRAGRAVTVKGFLNRKNRMSAQLVLHATAVEAGDCATG